MYRVLGNISPLCEGQRINFLVNASPPELLDIENSNLAGE